MSEKLNLGILFGGRSCEHEVSVTSAKSMLESVNQDKYNIHLIGIDKDGHWHLGDSIEQLIQSREVRRVSSEPRSTASDLVCLQTCNNGNLEAIDNTSTSIAKLDVVFPMLHGTFGEDGTIQGLFELAGIPYVGCGVAASAIAMDKALAKQVFSAAGIPQAPCEILHYGDWLEHGQNVIPKVEQKLGYPMFVKPANMGSSVGVSKAANRNVLVTGIEHAFEFDNKVVVESSMENCHEVECSVLGNNRPIASLVGEILPGAEFYNYETKYLDDKSETRIPADIPENIADAVRDLAIRAFRAIDGSGLSRVDFFVNRENHAIYLNEINTLPGFTPISMYPKMWQASGINYPDLIDQLIELAISRNAEQNRLKRAL
ncbi:MAG: D-alanine--D-alanine ligase family protein [Pseudomonadota bacterium]